MFAIGAKGAQPRMYLDGTNITADDAARQLKTGEIYFECSAHGGQGATINAAGNGFDAHVVTLAEVQATAWTAAKVYREQMRNGGCMAPKGRIQTDTASQRLIDQKGMSASRWVTQNSLNLLNTVKVAIGTWSVDWVMMDNTTAPHSATDFVALHEAVIAHNTACQSAGAAIRAKIFGATTVAAVQAIDVTSGYPSG